MLETALRVLALCLALAGTETLHGIARTVFLAPRIGKERAIKLSIVSSSLLAFLVCLLLVPGIKLESFAAHGALGIGLALFMASFDITLGRFLLRRPWAKIWTDFDPRTGNYLLLGLILLTTFPALVALLRS